MPHREGSYTKPLIAAIKLLTLSVAGIEFITIMAITFVGSIVAAALIKPAEAMHFLGNLGIGRAAKDRKKKADFPLSSPRVL
jgi:hypothetical protein